MGQGPLQCSRHDCINHSQSALPSELLKQRSNDVKLRDRENIPLGKSDNPLNIFSWTHVWASFNPSNHINTQHNALGFFLILKALHVAAEVLCPQNIWDLKLPIFFSEHQFRVEHLLYCATRLKYKIHGPPFYIHLLSNLMRESQSARTAVSTGQREKSS